MRSRSFELLWALLLILLAGGLYLLVTLWQGAERTAQGLTIRLPAPGGGFGHSLGILGLGLMLFTEAGYSLRKRSASARWGRTTWWLQAHIVSGLLGAFLVVLHTGGNFRGLAGLSAALAVTVAASGFIGRYLYTAVPRAQAAGSPGLRSLRRWLALWYFFHIPLAAALFATALLHVTGVLYFILPLR